MKPIGLAVALQLGIPITRFYDATSPIEITNPPVCGPTWKVRGGAEGDRTLADATKWSQNTIYAQLMVDIGPARFVQMAEDLGIGEGRVQPVCARFWAPRTSIWSRWPPSIRPSPARRSGRPRDGHPHPQRRGHPAVRECAGASHRAQQDGQRPTDLGALDRHERHRWRANLPDYPDAGKTGTAQNNADATFVGYTRQRATAVWVGYPDEQIPMRTQFEGDKVEGGTFPALIWHEIMTAAMSGLEPQPFPTPPASSTTTTLPDIPEEAIVPPLLGQDATEEFIAALQGEPDYWVIQRVDIETRGYTPELIIRQSPKAGELVPGGSIITIEVAVPPEVFPVPPVVGLSEAEAAHAWRTRTLRSWSSPLPTPTAATATCRGRLGPGSGPRRGGRGHHHRDNLGQPDTPTSDDDGGDGSGDASDGTSDEGDDS